MVEVPATVIELFKFMTPVPDALTVPDIVIPIGAVAVTPPVKMITSDPSPNVRLPVLEKVVAPAIELLEPVNDTL